MNVWEIAFGMAAEPIVDGPAEVCPSCHGIVDPLALTVELVTGAPLACAGCGAVLAA